LRTLFNAIYTPNAANTTDTVESGKGTITYTTAISQAALALFKITIGPASSQDKVQIKGTALPTAQGASSGNLIVIDIGVPGGTDNSGLPTFYIPHQGLGASTIDGDYSHIRFRVNKGASLVIEADNTAYEAADDDGIAGAGNAGATGYFKGGCVEVMDGGKLRDGAWEGFPLGTDAVILNRYNSYLAVGPETYKNQDMLSYTGTDAPQKYYSGWLIGPSGASPSPRIEWDTGNGPASYVEVRPGEIATDAKLTAKKSLGLIYSVWFVNGAQLTIDVDAQETPIFTDGQEENPTTLHGIAANESKSSDFNFYADSSAEASVSIIIKQGNFLDGRFLSAKTGETEDTAVPVMATSGDITLNTTSETTKEYGDGTGITGKLISPPESD
jgi:hypothetical protein